MDRTEIFRRPGHYLINKKPLLNRYKKSQRVLLHFDKQQSKGMSFFPLLDLPIELRLEIYRHCSAYTILQLSHSSRQLRFEIQSYPQIVGQSFGYFALWFKRISRSLARPPTDSEYGTVGPWSWNFGKVHDRLSYDGQDLTIRHISALEDLLEVRLYNKQHSLDFMQAYTVIRVHNSLRRPVNTPKIKLAQANSDRLPSRQRLVCELCFVVKLTSFFHSNSTESLYCGSYSAICNTCVAILLLRHVNWEEPEVSWLALELRASHKHGELDYPGYESYCKTGSPAKEKGGNLGI
ncbi:hypothetical protein BJ508DRAFT_156660 [Ascobolus immersus RN42]|uniref:F-box domain-containing protein n=1 Tax=Ascobolus immersus RN42 TaxID=1160509 RepID=A0A3N4HYR7_ASCIM|nr:hypothetical protein BJ508DRAFT_156660 [Ascobolus immersus RN42]